MLHPVSRPCVSTAFTLYSRILDRIEAMEHNVFSHRATVSRKRRLAVAGTALTYEGVATTLQLVRRRRSAAPRRGKST